MDFSSVFNLSVPDSCADDSTKTLLDLYRLIWLVIFAAIVYIIQGAPINEGIKRVITTVAVVAAVIWAIRWLLGLRH